MDWRKALAAALGAHRGGAAAADLKIGFVNTERVFREAAPAKRAQQKLEREFSARNAELAKLEKQGRDLQVELENDSVTLPEAARREKERMLADVSRNFQRLQREIREDLNLRRNEELAQVQERATRVINQIAEAGEVRPDRAGGRVRELPHRHHRQGHQGARGQVAARGLPCPPSASPSGKSSGASAARSWARRRVAVTGVATLDEAGPGEITFLANPRYRRRLAATRAGAVILGPRRPRRDRAPAHRRRTIPTPTTRAPWRSSTRRSRAVRRRAPDARSSTRPRVVAASARDRAVRRDRAPARASASARAIGAGSRGGRGRHAWATTRVLHPRVTIYHGCVVGARCILHSGAVIGADGFGMAPDAGRAG